jgi:hypothetical protein
LRGIEKNAPWIEDIFVVTSGQIPGFLDMSNPHVHIVPHSQIFPNAGDLPTFSSNAIESSFHNLPDSVGDCFVYLNDDMFFANTVLPSDFWTRESGQVLYESGWTAPPPQSRMNNIWHRSVGYSNALLDQLWDEEAERHYASHGPYFFSMKVLKHMYEALKPEFDATTGHPFRQEDDVSIPFLYNQFVIHYYKHVIAGQGINHYVKMEDDPKKDGQSIQSHNRESAKVCVSQRLIWE